MTSEPTDPRADHLRLLEALLFASQTPVDDDAIKVRLPADADIPSLLAELAEHYRGRGVNLVQVAGGWTVRTASDLGPRLKLVQKISRKLSRAAMETLAIVAYHQPVTRAEIEDIRGVVVSSGTLDLLMEIGWIAPKGRRQTVGRPVTWGTTDAFLLHFGLASAADLPGIEELRAAGLIGPRPEMTLSETGKLADLPMDSAEAPGADAEAEAEAAAAAEELGGGTSD
jgi:segregation and condensation protein B